MALRDPNVIWMAIGEGVIDETTGTEFLPLSDAMVTHTIPTQTLWSGALWLAVTSGLPAYDALFVAVAERENAMLATFDQGIIKAFPQIAKSPGAISG